MREFFNQIFHAAPATQGRADAARTLARFAVLGAFVLGFVPGGRAALAQARKAAGSAPEAASGVKKTSKTETPKAAPAAKAEAAKPESAKVDVKPIKAFLARSRRLHADGKLDLSKPQTIVVEGDRQEDGTLMGVQITGESTADPAMRAVAQDFVASVNDSHALAILSDVSRVRMTFTLDGERFKALTTSDAPSEARADEMARNYRMLINAGRLMKRGTDEGALLSGMKVSASGKQLLMNLDMPREQMGNILLRQITPN
jgi:pyruvate/2-oxoglutarate dehydrogenase complex dihydrolipoamide acyltransferase (E2) component